MVTPMNRAKLEILDRIYAMSAPMPEGQRVLTPDEALEARVGEKLVVTPDGGLYFCRGEDGYLLDRSLLGRLHGELVRREVSLSGLTLKALRDWIQGRVESGLVPVLASQGV